MSYHKDLFKNNFGRNLTKENANLNRKNLVKQKRRDLFFKNRRNSNGTLDAQSGICETSVHNSGSDPNKGNINEHTDLENVEFAVTSAVLEDQQLLDRKTKFVKRFLEWREKKKLAQKADSERRRPFIPAGVNGNSLNGIKTMKRNPLAEKNEQASLLYEGTKTKRESIYMPITSKRDVVNAGTSMFRDYQKDTISNKSGAISRLKLGPYGNEEIAATSRVSNLVTSWRKKNPETHCDPIFKPLKMTSQPYSRKGGTKCPSVEESNIRTNTINKLISKRKSTPDRESKQKLKTSPINKQNNVKQYGSKALSIASTKTSSISSAASTTTSALTKASSAFSSKVSTTSSKLSSTKTLESKRAASSYVGKKRLPRAGQDDGVGMRGMVERMKSFKGHSNNNKTLKTTKKLGTCMKAKAPPLKNKEKIQNVFNAYKMHMKEELPPTSDVQHNFETPIGLQFKNSEIVSSTQIKPSLMSFDDASSRFDFVPGAIVAPIKLLGNKCPYSMKPLKMQKKTQKQQEQRNKATDTSEMMNVPQKEKPMQKEKIMQNEKATQKEKVIQKEKIAQKAKIVKNKVRTPGGGEPIVNDYIKFTPGGQDRLHLLKVHLRKQRFGATENQQANSMKKTKIMNITTTTTTPTKSKVGDLFTDTTIGPKNVMKSARKKSIGDIQSPWKNTTYVGEVKEYEVVNLHSAGKRQQAKGEEQTQQSMYNQSIIFKSTKEEKTLRKENGDEMEIMANITSDTKIPLTTPSTFVGECIEYAPGVEKKRRKIKKRTRKLHFDSDDGDDSSSVDIATLMEENLNRVNYFRRQVNIETDRLDALCRRWELYKYDHMTLLQNTGCEDMINASIGQTRLLTSKKFKQFKELIGRCEQGITLQGPAYDGSEDTKLITVIDLEGFWSMVCLQIYDIDKRFDNLENLRANDWIERFDPETLKLQKQPIAKAKLPTKKVAKFVTKGKPAGTANGINAKANVVELTKSGTGGSVLENMIRRMRYETRMKKAAHSNSDDVMILTPSSKRCEKPTEEIAFPSKNKEWRYPPIPPLLTPVRIPTPKNVTTEVPGLEKYIADFNKSLERLKNGRKTGSSNLNTSESDLYSVVPKKSILKTPGSPSRGIRKSVIFSNKRHIRQFSFPVEYSATDDYCEKNG